MGTVNITINGQKVVAQEGQTIYEAATAAGIDIPHLCHHPAVQPIGACRVCLVEVAKQRTLQPACTFRVFEGMEVQTESPEVVKARKFVLQLLFSERNHYCMYCQMSGSCELQDLAYRYGMDHWLYERPYPKLPVDSSRVYFEMDHNRCILCRRCIRACGELVGNHTLGLKNRGANTMITADMDTPFGESSCVSCGTCLQVCPTGALMDYNSAYMARRDEVDRIKSTCMACSVGCGVELVVRDNQLLRIEGDWDSAPNKGLLCVKGRFEPLFPDKERVTTPLVKKNGKFVEASLDEALDVVASELNAFAGEVAAVASGSATNESLSILNKAFDKNVWMMEQALAADKFDLTSLDEADLFIVTGVDLTEDHQVAGFFVKRGVTNRHAALVLLGEDENGLAPLATYQWGADQVAKAIELAEAAVNPVVIYGVGAGDELATLRKALQGKARFVGLVPGSNVRGATAMGVKSGLPQGARGVYVLAGDADGVGDDFLNYLKKADFVAVQASFLEPWNKVADVILPSPTWFEKNGTWVNTEGCEKKLVAAVDTGRPDEAEVLEVLSAKLGA